MTEFVISPHMRLHEWVAEENGYFADAGLDYVFREQLSSRAGSYHDLGDRVGAYQTFERGRSCDISAACHWTVNAAASSGHGRLYTGCYSVSPCGIFVPEDSGIRSPEDLAGVPISAGYQSGSHYSTIQALEEFLDPGDIRLSFAEGLLFHRLEMLVDGKIPAASLFSGPFYLAEQLGFRKIVDTSFMIASMVTGDPDAEDVEKYFNALRRAQTEIDLRLELCRHHYRKEFPARFQGIMDVRRFGPGERLVFENYSEEIFTRSRNWVAERGIFPDGGLGEASYEDSIFQAA